MSCVSRSRESTSVSPCCLSRLSSSARFVSISTRRLLYSEVPWLSASVCCARIISFRLLSRRSAVRYSLRAASRCLGRRLLNGGQDARPPVVDLLLELLHRGPLGLVGAELLGVLALHPGLLRAERSQDASDRRLGDRLGGRVLQLLIARLLADALRDGRVVVLADRLDAVHVARLRVRDDVVAAREGQEGLLLLLDLALGLLDLRRQKLGRLADLLEARLDVPLDVGVRDAVGDARREPRRGRLVGDLDEARAAHDRRLGVALDPQRRRRDLLDGRRRAWRAPCARRTSRGPAG